MDFDELDWASDSNKLIKQEILSNLSLVDEYGLKMANIKISDEKVIFYANMIITQDLINETIAELQETFKMPFEFESCRLMLVNSKPCMITTFTQ